MVGIIVSRRCVVSACWIAVFVVTNREVACQILALNAEKMHNLKERSREVIRIYRGLIEEDAHRPESGFSFYLGEAALVTLGVCYERVQASAASTILSCAVSKSSRRSHCTSPSRSTRSEPAWCATWTRRSPRL